MAFSAIYDTGASNRLVAVGSVVGGLRTGLVAVPCRYTDATPDGTAPDFAAYQWNPSTLRFEPRPATVPSAILNAATTLMNQPPANWVPADQITALRILMYFVLGQFK